MRPVAVLAAALIAESTTHGQGREIRRDYTQRIDARPPDARWHRWLAAT